MQTHDNRIGELRRAKGWSLAALAKQVGTTAATIDRLEKSKIRLTVEWMRRLAGPLGVLPADLVPWSEDVPRSAGGRGDQQIRRAIHEAHRVIAEAIKRAPEAVTSGVAADVEAMLVLHSLDGFPMVGEGPIASTVAFLLLYSGDAEKAKEGQRRLNAMQESLKEEDRELERKREEFGSLGRAASWPSIRISEREMIPPKERDDA